MKRLLFSAMALVFLPLDLDAQYFGKNKVQYTDFEWKYLQSKYFDIYFTAGGEEIANFVATEAEAAYRHLSADFRYEMTDRITIIVHNSHNDFEQSNVDLSPPEEAVGGFTEFFKNRVVIPFDGSWERLRHVTHHELTHAVMLQMIFGTGAQAIISGLARLRLPLWFVEGLAEFESRGWDTESDMFMRDAAINNYLPNSLDMFGGFLAYKGGQSLWYYIAEKYGEEKIGEILSRVKVRSNLEAGLKAALGMGSEDLARNWLKYVRQRYWPELAGRQEPADFAKPLTDHRHWHNFVNNSPALSPGGDKIAFLSDRSDYFDIYLMSTIEGQKLTKLVSGQKSGMLEELHWLRPGISWSPDGRHIAFASKSGKEDELHILDVTRKKIVRCKKFGLDGVFSPAWSPRPGGRDQIAFAGFINGQSDIYLWDTRSDEVRKLTNDLFSDLEPSWSPDGRHLAFVSDRGWAISPPISADFKIAETDYHNLDIYIIDTQDRSLYRVTETPAALEHTPVFSPVDASKLAFTSDRSGIFNIYLRDLRSAQEYPITDVHTGISHLSWARDGAKGLDTLPGSQMAFVSFYEAGYDIYLLRNPLGIKPGEVNPANTGFMIARAVKRDVAHLLTNGTHEKVTRPADNQFRDFIFGEEPTRGAVNGELNEHRQGGVALDSVAHLLPGGRYKVHDYKTKFSPDILFGNAGYSQYFGVQGLTQLSFSDVLGNQRFNVYTSLYGDVANSNLLVNYFYLPKQTNVGVSAFQTAYFFVARNGSVARDRSYGFNLMLSRPFDRYRRTDFTLTMLGIERDWVAGEISIPAYRRNVLFGEFVYVTDISLWGFTGPTNGARSNLSVTYSPRLGENGLDFFTVRGEWRRYYKVSKEYLFAVRFAGGRSDGRTPQQFFLGGVDNWINRAFADGYLRVDRIEDIYFSRFETPFRGLDFYERIGNRFVLANLEFRFPLIRYLQLGFPLPLTLYNVRGALFTDIGTAWNKNEPLILWHSGRNGIFHLNDLLMTYGVSARTNLGFLILIYDIAWRTDLQSAWKPRHVLSAGVEF